MKTFSLGLLAVVFAAALGVYLMARRPISPAAIPQTSSVEPAAPSPVVTVMPASTPPPQPAVTEPAASPTVEPKPARRGRLAIKPGQPIPELFPHQAERDQLLNLAASQDPRNIPLIASSLRHADATVREAARQALVQMGDAAALPHLKAAEAASKDPAEAELLREAIEFLSLPKFMDVITSSPGVSPGL